MADSTRSEDVYGEKIDRCMYNALVKLVGGVGAGIVFSALLFKRKPWPLVFGGGIGIGMGLSDCNYEFQDDKPKTTNLLFRSSKVPSQNESSPS